jgi:hypothetical protein
MSIISDLVYNIKKSTNRTIYLNRKQSILMFIEYLPMNILKE